MNVHERFSNYQKEHCWQYEIRQKNLAEDLLSSGLSKQEMDSLSISDFVFDYVDKTDKPRCSEIKDFISEQRGLSVLST